MSEGILTHGILVYAMAITVGLGGIGKLISQITLRKMVKAASEIGKSNHKLMKLIRAKFEHASMVSDRVQNVEAFVSKYLFEYRVLGLKLHEWRGVLKQSIWIYGVLGALGVAFSYWEAGMGEQVFQYAAWTGVGSMVLFLVHISTDDEYFMQMTENYIVDYLENVCAYRYARANERKDEMVLEPQKENEVEIPTLKQEKTEEKTAEREQNEQEMRIREILEEFLA